MSQKYQEFFVIDRLGLFVLLQKYLTAREKLKHEIPYEELKEQDEYKDLKKYFINIENFAKSDISSPSHSPTPLSKNSQFLDVSSTFQEHV